MFHIFIFQSRKDKLKCELENVMVFLMWKSVDFFSKGERFRAIEAHPRDTVKNRVTGIFKLN
jgi:hypothetical protein